MFGQLPRREQLHNRDSIDFGGLVVVLLLSLSSLQCSLTLRARCSCHIGQLIFRWPTSPRYKQLLFGALLNPHPLLYCRKLLVLLGAGPYSASKTG